MRRIAIIEDEPIDSNNIKSLIEKSLDDVEVRQAFTKADAEILLNSEKFDVVIMDVELGKGAKNRYAGLSLLSDIRGNWATIVVSGMPEDNLRGLSVALHAYDFIAKPVDEQDVINKIEKALEWLRADPNKGLVSDQALPAGLEFDSARKNKLLWQGKTVQLSITQLNLVLCLIEHPGQVVDQTQLIKNLKSGGSSKAVATQISGARAAFRDVDPTFNKIDNEPGRGYFWKTT